MTERIRKSEGKPKIETVRSGHITDLHLPNGTVRIIYGAHNLPTSPKDIPQNTDGIFLETTSYYDPVSSLNYCRSDPQYSDVIERAESGGVPIFFHDIKERFTGGILPKIGIYAYATIGPFVPALYSFFLSRSIVEGVAVSSPILYNSAATYGTALAAKSSHREHVLSRAPRIISKSTPHMFPLSLRLRNALWASKINWALENNHGDHLTTVVGALHVGLELYLKREALGKSSRILAATTRLWDRIGELESFYQITRVSKDPNTGEFSKVDVFEVPELKQFAAQSPKKRGKGGV